MESRLRSVGVVLAGGVGRRIGLDTPKQLIKIAGRTILEHTLALFNGSPEIDEIVVLMAPGFADTVGEIVEKGGFDKVSQIVEGGASRTESTWRALKALGPQECNVLLHDAVRPLLEPRIITECVRALRTYSAVEVAIPSSDTILVAAPGPGGDIIHDIPDRSWLRRAQTPQCFRLSLIREAYELAFADPDFDQRPATDDCGVLLRYLPDVPIYIVPGSEQNMKITHPVDVYIADKLLQLAGAGAPRPDARDYREALDGRTLVVFDGGQGIGADVVELAAGHGARVHSFSRAQNGVRVEDYDSVVKALAQVGRIDFVVNTPGAPHTGRLAEVTHETIAETVGLDYLGPVNVARAAYPHLRESAGRLLLCTGGRAGHSLGSSTEAAVVDLTRALADEWADDGIRVNCVKLGPLSPSAIARTALDVLVSDLTGQVIDVRADGA
ncbi:bifunctional cytidylyltransferase/SDR family oxidoreductase [Nonomuraea sp. NEAU-A123]|uniref:bifunctional cytidylyltransferase/SDR family oxidoreductase n=1 Tax=Nonomuraea sp. NEAU-A123 TaxID=2839649 RepID=UPI001BE43ED8|nr:bifunctional cytidylyltransferase/SDR family oxidoreductase [Nonomuraea sp. NEAU-A123]MBT2224583.1 bifunctional cytidylyltransferase/SDR family oxidoreductase [Nonomuraea sp. NEAU-A123]